MQDFVVAPLVTITASGLLRLILQALNTWVLCRLSHFPCTSLMLRHIG